MKLSRTFSTLHLSASMNLAGNYPPLTEVYSENSYGSPYQLPSPSTDASYIGWSYNSPNTSTLVHLKDYPNKGIKSTTGTIKKRVSANRKERRRTLSINNAFQELRECIPNVPSDTKLSKIKTLKLATSYISYLYEILAQDEPNSASSLCGFKNELSVKLEPREHKRNAEAAILSPGPMSDKKPKGRTGWPQHMWAIELKHET